MKNWYEIADQLEKTAKNCLLHDDVNILMQDAAAQIRKDSDEMMEIMAVKTMLSVENIRMKEQIERLEKEKEELEERIAIMTESEVEYVDPEWPPMEGNDDD